MGVFINDSFIYTHCNFTGFHNVVFGALLLFLITLILFLHFITFLCSSTDGEFTIMSVCNKVEEKKRQGFDCII